MMTDEERRRWGSGGGRVEWRDHQRGEWTGGGGGRGEGGVGVAVRGRGDVDDPARAAAMTMNMNPLHVCSRSILQRQQHQQHQQHPHPWQQQHQQPPQQSSQHHQNQQMQRWQPPAPRHNDGGRSGYTHLDFDGTHHANPTMASTSGNHSSPCHTAASSSNLSTKRRRVRSILLLSALGFAGVVFLDGLLKFSPRTVHDTVESAADAIDGYERRLNDELMGLHHGEGGAGSHHEKEGVAGKLLRRLVDSLLDEDDVVGDNEEAPPHRSYERNVELGMEGNMNAVDANDGRGAPPLARRRALHTLPLLPKHALQHRMQRELIARQMPIPEHLREGADDDVDHAEDAQRRRRRMYPVLKEEGGEEIVDLRRLVEEGGGDGGLDAGSVDGRYETGALYQGYGTHYLDLWVGTPPQRQTVIVDTGSSITAFPCSGCQSCGTNPTTGEQYHLDEDFDTAQSETYEEQTCRRGKHTKGKTTGYVPCGLGTCTRMTNGNHELGEHCQLAVSYAEGSTWKAVEGVDVVYPAGPHEAALVSAEERLAAGVGVGMGSLSDGSGENEEDAKDFDWMDFRLRFGCQSKVTGLFRTQLEDGIMGMDNRRGAFWMQLHEHYSRNGYLPIGGDGAEGSFDPAQFSLCYDRQPLSMDLTPGVGSGALTLGGTDVLLHNTDMVYAENVTPQGGWYTVRIKAIFLRTGGGTLSEPPPVATETEYVRVDAEEAVLNGNSAKDKGVIVDSGTTDTYLPQGLRAPFNEVWYKAVGSNYQNNLQEMTPEQVKSLPTILLVLQGHATNEKEDAIGMTRSHGDMLQSKGPTNQATISESDVVVAIPPSHYMEESHREPGKYTARIYFTERFGAQSILGSNFLMGHEVNFDVGRGRIGFAESHCNYGRYLQERNEREQSLAVAQPQQEEDISSRVAQSDEEESTLDNDATMEAGNDLAVSGWAIR